MNNNSSENTGNGYLTVKVTTARGAIPLEGATVTVRGSEKESSGVILAFISDADGLTPQFVLPAPPRANSESPGIENPFSIYNLEVALDGYYTQNYYQLPVFEGITAMQTVDMIVLPENGIPDRFTLDGTRHFEGGYPDL